MKRRNMAAELHQDFKECPGRAVVDVLETARVRLRLFRNDDLDELSRITRDPDVMRHIGSGSPLTRQETEYNLVRIIESFLRRGFGRWAVEKKETGTLIGYCGLSYGHEEIGMELAYLFAREEWGKGLATEAAAACMRYGFEHLGLGKISALTRHENSRSRRVMERIGMRFLREGHYYGYSCVCYAIEREEWQPDDSMYRIIS